MSSITKSLEKRIQELNTSIDTQKAELAAYEKVLAVELGMSDAPHEASSEMAHTHAPKTQAVELSTSTLAPDLSELEYAGNKTNLVAAIVKAFSHTGATPKEVDSVFTDRKVPKSKNLIYNTLSYLVAHKRLVRKDGRYFALDGAAPKPRKKSGPKPSKAAKPAKAKKAKRFISAEGIERIREANQKRWAAKRAADATAAAKPRGKKKAA